MFNFHKYIAGFTLLGVSVQSIFGYGILLIGAGYIATEVVSTIKISAAGTAIPAVPAYKCIGPIQSGYYKINYYIEDSSDYTGALDSTGTITGIPNGIGSFQGYFDSSNSLAGFSAASGSALWAQGEGYPADPIAYPNDTCTPPIINFTTVNPVITDTDQLRTYTITGSLGCTGATITFTNPVGISTLPTELQTVALDYTQVDTSGQTAGSNNNFDITVAGAGICANAQVITNGVGTGTVHISTNIPGNATAIDGGTRCVDFGNNSYYKINYYTQDNPEQNIPLDTYRTLSGIITGTGSFQGYGTGGGTAPMIPTFPVINPSYAVWAEPQGTTRYYDNMCTNISAPILDYTVTPLSITSTGVVKTQIISSTNGACTGVILSRSGTIYTSTGIQTIIDSSPISLSSTGYFQYVDSVVSQPGDNADIDITVAGVGVCAGQSIVRHITTKVPELTFTVQNQNITTAGSGRIYDITSLNSVCSHVDLSYSDGRPSALNIPLPYHYSDYTSGTPVGTGVFSNVTVIATATGTNCNQAPRISVSKILNTDTRTAVNPPGAPTGISATAGNGQAIVSFTAPGSNGGATITNYTVTSSPGSVTSTSTASPITVTGLTNGTPYIFTVTATNSAGTGSASPSSNSVTPTSGVTPINGSCGTSSGASLTTTPTTNLCSSGAPGSVTDGGVGGIYSWSCGGSGGGTSMSCSAGHISLTQTGTCGGTLSGGSISTNPGGVSTFTRTWNGAAYSPLSANWAYSTTGSPSTCTFACGGGYSWGGSSCIAIGTGMVSITSPVGTINTGTPRFTGSSGTGVSQVVIYKSGGLFLGSGMIQSGSYSFTSALTFSDGIHTIIVTGKDTLGNSGSSTTGSFTVDTIAPTAPVLSTPGPFMTTTPTFSGSAESGAILEIRSGGTGGTLLCSTSVSSSGSWSCGISSPTLSIGTSTLTFLARDAAGNIGSIVQSISVLAPGSYISTGMTLSGISISGTGSRFLSNSGVYFLSGSVLSIRSGSIFIVGSGGTLTLTGNTDIRVGSGIWDTSLLGPTNVEKNNREYLEFSDTGVTANLPQNNTSTNYTHKILDTFLMGGSGTVELALSGQLARIDLFVTGSRIGDTVRIFRSSDGQTWILNSPDTTCVITSANRCQFSTDHFSYFGLVESTPIQISSSISSGPGGGGGNYVTYPGGQNNLMTPTGLQYLAIYGGNSVPLDVFFGMKPLWQNIAVTTNNLGETGTEISEMRCDLEKKVEKSEFLFRDISRSAFRSSIEQLTEYWIVRNQEKYRPTDALTKGDFLTFAVRAMRCHYSTDEFDTAKGRGYRTSEGVSRYIGLAEKLEWIGRGFHPEQTITRKEALEIISTMLGRDGSSSYKALAENLDIIDPGMDIRTFTYKTLSRGEGAEIVARAFLSE